MPETRLPALSVYPRVGISTFPALSVYHLVGISRSASETDDRFYLTASLFALSVFLCVIIFICSILLSRYFCRY